MSKAAARSAPEQSLEITGGGWEQAIRRRSGQHDGVEIPGPEPGTLECLFAGLAAQHGYRLLRSGNVALADSGPLHDPLVGGVEHPGKIGVGEDAGRNGNADAGHLGKGALDHAWAAASR